MLGLDAELADRPDKKRVNYEVQSVMNRNKATLNLIFDRELTRLKSNREKVSGFFREQQRWLADLKCEIDTGFAGVPAVRKTVPAAVPHSVNFYPQTGGNNSLFELRNNLSDLMR